MSDAIDVISDVSSAESDAESDAIILDFEEIIQQLEILQHLHEDAITRLQRLHTHQENEWDALLDELHAKSLQEIEQTGQSSFGATLLDRIEKLKCYDTIYAKNTKEKKKTKEDIKV